MDTGTPVKQGTRECPVARPDFQHLPVPHINEVGYPVDRLRVNKEVLVVVRFHFEVKT
jgi:hypothetical protein